MIFVDTWAWLALAVKRDQYHRQAVAAHSRLQRAGRKYITTNFVLSELITELYHVSSAANAERFVDAILAQSADRRYRLVHISPSQFELAWERRRKYADKPDISLTDFTSFVVMQELGIDEVFTGDEHFVQTGMGFRLVP